MLILSIPPATTMLLSPVEMVWEARMMDFRPLAQTLFTVVASDDDGIPAASAT